MAGTRLFKPQRSYKILFMDFTGTKYFVQFFKGVGVLSEEALQIGRPEWFRQRNDGTLGQYRGVPIAEYVEYWERVGGEVVKIKDEDATKLLAEIQTSTVKYNEEKTKATLKKMKEDGASKPIHPDAENAPEPVEIEEETSEETPEETPETPAKAEDLQPHEEPEKGE